jgi:CSLREA domain-containing protein
MRNTFNIFVFIFFCLVSAGAANAAAFTVTKTADTNDGVCDVDCSLREAVAAANQTVEPDTISFSSLFNTNQTITLSGGRIFFTNFHGAVTIAGPGRDLLSISGNNLVGIFEMIAGAEVSISGITIRNSFPGLDFGCGAILNNGQLNLSNLRLTNSRRGAICSDNAGNVVITNTIVSNNVSQASDPSSPAIVNTGVMNITGSTITDNSHAGSSGGGGIYNSGAGSGVGTMTIDNTVIGNNTASGGSGGGVINDDGMLTISNSAIGGNFAGGSNGGGIFSFPGTSVVTISNTTISRNLARVDGGGLYMQNGIAHLNHVTISNNISDADNNGSGAGGGVFVFGASVNVHNTVIGDNDFPGDSSPDYVGAFSSQGYNLLEKLPGSIISGDQTGNIYGQDPEFGRLANSSDPVITRNLLPTSPLIDRGDPSSFLPTDQRGILRPEDGDLDGVNRADIGAYERQVTLLTVSKIADTNDGICDSDCSLREALAVAANGSTPDNWISFDEFAFGVPRTIVLTSPMSVPDNGKTLVIDGPEIAILTINGNNLHQFIFNQGEMSLDDLHITECRPNGGTSPIRNNGWMSLNRIVMTNNSTISGGGAISNLGRMRIVDSTLSDNSAPSSNTTHDGGGAIENDSGTLTIFNSRITNNTTNAVGGGIRTEGGGTTEIFGSLIGGNRAISGGGIYHSSGGSNGTMNVTNSTISGNTATGDGGGGIRTAGSITMNLVNVTVARNAATNSDPGNPVGGGFRNSNLATTVSARNTIIADNSAVSNTDFVGNLNSQGYNLIEDPSGLILFGSSTGNILGWDPRLRRLAANGGPTLTHALRPGSPAIDAASPTGVLAIDQRGFARPKDGDRNGTAIADIGAFEFDPAIDNETVFDFDGDGKTDVGIFRPSVGEWWIYRSSDGQVPAFQFGASTDKIAPADFTGDGKTDIAFFRPSTGEWFVLRSEDNSYFSFPFGAAEDIPVPADYDGDGKADPAVFRPSVGTWFINRSSDGGTTSAPFGGNGDVPIPADYDGDGKADLAIYHTSAGEWWLNRSTTGLIVYQFGNSTDKIVPGDYTGDGKTDVAFWRPSTGQWFILRSEDTSYYAAPFGTAGDIPTPGDYDGDGKFDVTVFRPSTGTWFVTRTSGGTSAQQFGANGDRPLPTAFLP